MNTAVALLAAIELLAPASDEPFRLLPTCQRTIITNETMEARQAIFDADRKGDKHLRHSHSWRKSRPLVFKWKTTAGEGGPWEIKLSKNEDMSDARVWFMRAGTVDPATGREVASDGAVRDTFTFEAPRANLEIATKYYWCVSSDIVCRKHKYKKSCRCEHSRPSVCAKGSFVTEDLAPRWIAVEGHVGNFRDLGGRIGMGGRRVRQGMVYRSQGLNSNSIEGTVPGENRLTVEDVKYLTKTLGIKTELDIRSSGERANMKESPMGEGVKYLFRSSQAYDGIFKDSGKKTMAENFRVFCDRKNYPIIFHCIGGADRTGALGYVLNGVLGVCRRELETDWESTFYPNVPIRDADGKLPWNSELHFENGFSKHGKEGDSWNRRIELYLLDCGVTEREIEKFRSIMLED